MSIEESAWAVAASTVRLATPLTFACLGGYLSERSGVINIALEGMMLVGAFAAAVVAHESGSPWLGFVMGGGAGAVLAMSYAGLTIGARANQIVAGTGINMLAVGIPPFVAKVLYDVTGSTPSLTLAERFQYAPIVLVVVVSLFIAAWSRFLRSGLWHFFAGEKPDALSAAGISVLAVRWVSVTCGGFLAGLGGATLSILLSSSYSRNMAAGRGFIALAALILGKWRVGPAILACLFFGLTEALQIRLQGVIADNGLTIPAPFIQIVPYLATLVVLTGFVGRARPPAALGVPWRQG